MQDGARGTRVKVRFSRPFRVYDQHGGAGAYYNTGEIASFPLPDALSMIEEGSATAAEAFEEESFMAQDRPVQAPSSPSKTPSKGMLGSPHDKMVRTAPQNK